MGASLRTRPFRRGPAQGADITPGDSGLAIRRRPATKHTYQQDSDGLMHTGELTNRELSVCDKCRFHKLSAFIPKIVFNPTISTPSLDVSLKLAATHIHGWRFQKFLRVVGKKASLRKLLARLTKDRNKPN